MFQRLFQLSQCALFNARYITPRNAHPFCNLPLRQRCGQAEPVPQADDLALAGGKTMGERVVHGIVAVVLIDGGQPLVLAADDVLQGKGVAIPIGLERIRQRKLACGFAFLAEVHQQLVLDALGRIGRQTDIFIRPEGADRLDQPNRTNRYEIVLLGA